MTKTGFEWPPLFPKIRRQFEVAYKRKCKQPIKLFCVTNIPRLQILKYGILEKGYVVHRLKLGKILSEIAPLAIIIRVFC